jgi:hypothetical protein
MKVYGGSGGRATRILNLALDAGEWAASCSGRFTPGKRIRSPLERKLGGPNSRCERGGEEKNKLSLASAGSASPQPSHYTDCRVFCCQMKPTKFQF